MADGLREESLSNGETRLVFSVAPELAPISLSIFPLMKKEGLVTAAETLLTSVLPHARAEIDVTGAIGKRYRRADEAGTPLCATVDYQTLEDGTVTLRDRDTMIQLRMPIQEVVTRAAAGTLKPSALIWPSNL